MGMEWERGNGWGSESKDSLAEKELGMIGIGWEEKGGGKRQESDGS